MANRLGTNDPIYDASRLNTINLASNLGASPVDAITELTGDVTAIGPGSVPATLATVNANVGTFGSNSAVAQVTVNAKGLVTAAANVSIDPAAFDPHNDGRYLKLDASNDPLTGDLDVQVDDANALRVLTEATPSWTFPSSAILDTFNRGDEGPPPSANWSNPSGVDGLRVISSVCSTPLENSATAYAMWIPLSTLTDCECYATTVNSASTIGEFYFFARVQDPNNPLDDCYALHVHYDPTPGNSYSEFVFNLGGAPSTNNQVLLDWNLGDQWGLLTENSGIDVVLTAYRNGTAVNTWTDSSESGFAVGYIGLGIGGDDSDPAAYNAVDSFGGGAKVGSLTAQTVFNVNTLTKITTTERLESTVLSGLSPLIVASNTLVTNLNADLLDGQHASEFAPASHNVLSATHGDTLTASVVRGDVIVGNATPKWSRLPLGGITGSVLIRTATDVGWSAGALSFGGAFTLTIPATGTAAIATGIAGGQTIYGGDAANNDLTLEGTSHATKTTSYVILQPTGGYVGIGTPTPEEKATIVSTMVGRGAGLADSALLSQLNITSSYSQTMSAGRFVNNFTGDAGANVSSVYGIRVNSGNNGSGAITHGIGIKIEAVTNTGTAGNLVGLYVVQPSATSTGGNSAIHIDGADGQISFTGSSGLSYGSVIKSPSPGQLNLTATTLVLTGALQSNDTTPVFGAYTVTVPASGTLDFTNVAQTITALKTHSLASGDALVLNGTGTNNTILRFQDDGNNTAAIFTLNGANNLIVRPQGILYLSAGGVSTGFAFVDTAGQFISSSVGYIAPTTSAQLDVHGGNVTDTWYGTGNPGNFISRTARGTQASPSAVSLNDTIGGFGGRGYSTAFPSASNVAIIFVAAENFTATNQGTYIKFDVTPIASTTRATAMLLDSTGYLGIGDGLVPSARLHVVNTTTTTNAVTEVQRIEARISTAATGSADGFGPSQTFYAETSTADTYRQVGAFKFPLTNATDATRTSRADIETTGPGKCAAWGYNGVDGTARNIINNGTGDVTEGVTVQYVASEVTGTESYGGVVYLEPSDSFNICTDGTNTLTLTCAADGSLYVQRSAGTDTFKFTCWAVWQ